MEITIKIEIPDEDFKEIADKEGIKIINPK